MKDPKGNELKAVLLQILDKDEQGPISLRVRRDHEKIDLADDRNLSFLVVWAPADQILGEMRLADLYEDFQALKTRHAEAEQERVALHRAVKAVERDLATLEADNKTKTEALRTLQKERDPERLEALVRDRTAKLDGELIQARQEAAELRSWVEELRAAKKRLKEANERLKEKA